MAIKVRRIYEPAREEDGYRVLVDRLWPRGMSRERARLDGWLKNAAPSAELRRWFDHDPQRWDEFKRRYAAELAAAGDAVLTDLAERGRTGS